ncbi:MAG: DNA helicase II [Burkholderiaceae bacterium]|nr:MAG: DNA helicase II [Burkholderiaceae bacterium]
MSQLLQHLNEPQLAAVTLPPQSALILAGAGSGKTRVLTTRIAWLIQTGQVSPQGVLAVTFTNKAAKEMLTRLSAMLPINTRGMWIGTFHGLCNRLLRAHHRDAMLPQTFQILDTQDQLSAIKRLLKSLNVDDEKYPPKNLQYFINGAKEQGLRAHQVEVYDDYNRRFVELFAAYDEQCQREGVCDFPELMLRCYELLSRNQPLREHYQARFKHILVDEFQDTNPLQYQWLKLLAGNHSAMFAVGDDDQSIYAFRGANVGNMAQFEREFKVQNRIKLEQNYRSFGNILNAANTLIANNSKRLGKNLWTAQGEGEPIRIYEAMQDTQEAQWLVEEIRGLIRDGFNRSDIACLYRANAQSRVLEHALFNAGIPYRVYGGLRFFERAEIKHALAYLRLMENAHDDTAFARVVNFPTRGIGARSVEQLQDLAKQHGTSLYAAVPYLTGKPGSSIGAFVKMIEAMRFETQNLPLPEIVEHIIHASGLLTHYQGEKEGQERIENLNELVNAATAFISEEGYRMDAPATLGDAEIQIASPLAAFLSHAALEAGDNQAQAGMDAVQMMTVHAAKGLEFHAVFITGMEEGLFPHENSITEEDGLQEERRLMYVAITRARTKLYLSFSQSRMLHGQTRYGLRSRFFDELPEATLKWLTPKVQRYTHSHSSSAWDELPPVVEAYRKKASHDSGWRIGQSVVHAKFGEGVIVNIEGSGTDARVQINFGRHGLKLLSLAVAKLEAV